MSEEEKTVVNVVYEDICLEKGYGEAHCDAIRKTIDEFIELVMVEMKVDFLEWDEFLDNFGKTTELDSILPI